MKKILIKTLGLFLVVSNISSANIVTGIKNRLIENMNDVVNLVDGKISEKDLEKSRVNLTKNFVDGDIYNYGGKKFTGNDILNLLEEGVVLDKVMEYGVDTMTFPMDYKMKGKMSDEMFDQIIITLSGMNTTRVHKIDDGKYLIEEFKVARPKGAWSEFNYIGDKGKVFEWAFTNMMDSKGNMGWNTPNGIQVLGAMFTELSADYKDNDSKMPIEDNKKYNSYISIDTQDKTKGYLFIYRNAISITVPLKIDYSFGGYEISYDINPSDMYFNIGDEGPQLSVGAVLNNVLWFKSSVLKTSTTPIVNKDFRVKYLNSVYDNEFDFEATKFGIDFNSKL